MFKDIFLLVHPATGVLGVLGLLLFVGLGLAPFRERDLRGVAFLVLGSTVVSGLIIVGAAAVAAAL